VQDGVNCIYIPSVYKEGFWNQGKQEERGGTRRNEEERGGSRRTERRNEEDRGGTEEDRGGESRGGPSRGGPRPAETRGGHRGPRKTEETKRFQIHEFFSALEFFGVQQLGERIFFGLCP
jgi:hypothetical protein